MDSNKMVSFRTTEVTKRALDAVLKTRLEGLAGLGNLLIDSYITDPKGTIEALTKIKNKK